MNSLGFVNQITLPTYVKRTTGQIGSTIEHVWNNINVRCTSNVLTRHIADHHAISLTYDATLSDAATTIRCREFSVTNIENLCKKRLLNLTCSTMNI